MTAEIEVAVMGNGETNSRRRRLAATERVWDSMSIEEYVAQVIDGLDVGSAACQYVVVDAHPVPVAVMVGGWPVEGMCCGTTPDSGSILGGADRRRSDWECEGCATLVHPDYWAVMRLGVPTSGGALLVADPCELAQVADRALRGGLEYRNRIRAECAAGVVAFLHNGDSVDSVARHAFERPTGAQLNDSTLIAVVDHAADSAGRGRVEAGYVGVDTSGATDYRRYASRWVRVTSADLTVVQAAGLLAEKGPWRSAAAQGVLTGDLLRVAWQSAITPDAAVPGWLCDDAAVAQLHTHIGAETSPDVGIGW